MLSKYKSKNKKGFSLVEMLMYSALLSFFMIIVVNAAIIMTGAYARARSARLLNAAALSTMSTLSSEIRKSSDVLATSVLGTSPGVLVLSQPSASGADTVEIYSSGGRAVLRKNGIVIGNLSPEGSEVTSIIFHKISSTNGQAVRSSISFSANKGGEISSDTFYLTTALRESY